MTTRHSTLGDLFSATARAWPDRIAVVDEHERLDYRTLDATAAAWAAALTQRAGLRAGDTVVLCLQRNARLILAFHALARLGCTIVPVNHDTPEARLTYIAANADAKAVLTEYVVTSEDGSTAASIDDTPILDIATLPPPTASLPEAPVPSRSGVASESPAYVIFTSGTTGDPKGVAIGHDAILHRYDDWNAAFGLEQRPMRILQTAKPGFDVFIGDVVKAFGSGGTLVVCPDMAILEPGALVRWINDHRIDYIDIVPAILRVLIEHFRTTGGDLSGLAILNCGADIWTKTEYLQAKHTLRPGRLFNSYGVTECAVESTLFEDDGQLLQARDGLPIGRPLPNDRIMIVDESLRPLPDGMLGQLCLGGPCVAMGYIKDPERNARAFVMLPHAPEAGRVYLTGDFARIAPDGQIEFHGRNDTQIKIRGHRIEIHDIERVLERLPGVRQAVVFFNAEPLHLHAFVQMTDGTRFERETVAAFAAAQLPSYMRPVEILEVDDFPLNLNNKVDRKALFTSTRRSDAIFSAPWAGVLDASQDRETLLASCADNGIDLASLIAEFVKPSARHSIFVHRPLPFPDGRAVLRLEVIVQDRSALKKAHPELYGCPVFVHDGKEEEERLVEFTMRGLEMHCLFRWGARASRPPATDDLWIVHDDGPHTD